jgi:hypothetical protein
MTTKEKGRNHEGHALPNTYTTEVDLPCGEEGSQVPRPLG